MLIWLVIIGIWVLDRLIKVLILNNFLPGETYVVIPHVFHLTFVLNPGAAFGLFAGYTWFFVISSVLVAAGVVYVQFRKPSLPFLTRLAAGMIGGGALGNLYDRLTIGQVVDYLDFRIWPYVFNLADSMIVCGAGLLIFSVYMDEKRQESAIKAE